MKKGSIICLGIFVLAALLGLLQLWFALLSAELFSKVIITLGVAFVIALVVTLVKKEYIDDKNLKDSGFLD